MPKATKFSICLPDFEHSPIDIHSHFNADASCDFSGKEIHLRGFDFIESVYRNANVLQVGCSTFASVFDAKTVLEENLCLRKLTEENAWIYQWVVIDPRQEETYRQAEKMLSLPKVLGIKIHPDCHGYSILDYADGLFSFANEHKAVVLMHPQHIPQMAAFADKYPDMKLIIAHLGSVEHVDAIANARHGNIYTDTSGMASSRNNVIEYAVKRVGSEKILFGTDTYAFSFQFGRLALSDLPLQDKENILWKNAVRLFGDVFA